jgi:choline dehydrogenase-like flavoprotein
MFFFQTEIDLEVAMLSSPDVVIIGSGIGGGILANRLVQHGLTVTMLERGDYLPQEPANWDVNAVFASQRYVRTETWLDKQGERNVAQPARRTAIVGMPANYAGSYCVSIAPKLVQTPNPEQTAMIGGRIVPEAFPRAGSARDGGLRSILLPANQHPYY